MLQWLDFTGTTAGAGSATRTKPSLFGGRRRASLAPAEQQVRRHPVLLRHPRRRARLALLNNRLFLFITLGSVLIKGFR
jgi:hypothetical protein